LQTANARRITVKIIRGKWLVTVACFLIFYTTIGCAQSQNSQELHNGAGSFILSEATGATDDGLRVFYYRPAGWTPEKSIVIALHGVQRNAEKYCAGWQEDAAKYNLLVICPEFTEKKYPGAHYYNEGNVMDHDGTARQLQPREKWTFSVIEHVFNEVRFRAGATSNTFTLFGHSAGAQFVHRYLLFSPEPKADGIIVANAGWYTMPDSNINFPYGIKNTPVSETDLARAFAAKVTVLLGERDIDANSKILRHDRRADAQGWNRLERGYNFFNRAKEQAAKLGVPFNWNLVTVPGVGHDDTGMAAAAAKLIAEGQL